MKALKKIRLSVSIFGAVILALTTLVSAAEIQVAPLNPDFIAYMQKRERLKADIARGIPIAETEYPLGYIPPPVKLPEMPPEALALLNARSLPSQFDLRDNNKVTSVKNQGSEGACWSFATYGSMESCLLMQNAGTWDFAENHMVNLHGFDLGFGDGGNQFMATAYLARWTGPVLESEDPYPRPGQSPTTLQPRRHVQRVIFLPNASGTRSKTAIKQAIQDHGAVYTSMHVTNSYFNSGNTTYHYNGNKDPNHAVTIVGWDDNYSRTNFKVQPAGNGAFIVKNSWGTSWGDGGYFYASYYDTKFASANAVFVNAEPTTNYEKIYEHDPLGMVNNFGYSSSTAWGANIFTATASHQLRAVSFYALAAGTQYEIYIYTGITAGQPRSGTLRTTKTGTLDTAGYNTVSLPTAVSLTQGQRFSVVIKITTSGEDFPLAFEHALAGYSSQARASAGQSYHSANGTSWSDITAYDSTANLCIKAFAGEGSGPVPPPPPPPVADRVNNDFNGDGISNYAFYQYSTARWYVRNSANTGWMINGTQFGGYGWLPVPGDYDGSGRADAVLYSRWYGNWQIYMQQSGRARSANWGGGAFIPVAGDFDGDGIGDYALYNVNNGTWFIWGSTGRWVAYGQQFGGPGWLPFVGNYSGNRKGEVVIYNEASGDWYFLSLDTGRIGYQRAWGGPGFVPVPGDFDGDGITDFAAYNYQTGRWFIWGSSTADWIAQNWPYGGAGYLPVVGDYNGGGRDDPSVYSVSTGYWGTYLMETDESKVFRITGSYLAPIVPWWIYQYYGI